LHRAFSRQSHKPPTHVYWLGTDKLIIPPIQNLKSHGVSVSMIKKKLVRIDK
jgi:hypothetical protein